MSTQTINVNFNANDSQEATAVQTQETLISKPASKVNTAIGVAIALQVGKQVFAAATSNITNVTGRSDIQRQVNQGLNNGRIALQLGIGAFKGGAIGIAAVGALAIEMGINYAEQQIDIRNKNIEADFYRQSKGNIINRSRS